MTVPTFLKPFIENVEAIGLNRVGIYRLSGKKVDMQKIVAMINEGKV